MTGLVVLALVAAAAWGPLVSNVEQPDYAVVESHGPIEIRDYAPMIVAEVDVSGERKAAVNDGFRLVADYIFGNNSVAGKVAMTAPVIQQAGESIAMTAPVSQTGGQGAWQVRFVMPSGYTLETLPRPNNPAVRLRAEPGKRFAVIRFSGRATTPVLDTRTRELQAFMQTQSLQAAAQPTYAFYNPPWTLPFLRRNEVMIELD